MIAFQPCGRVAVERPAGSGTREADATPARFSHRWTPGMLLLRPTRGMVDLVIEELAEKEAQVLREEQP